MNDRIKELSSQARNYAREYVADCKQYGYYMEHNEYDLQFEDKFAELMAREAIAVVQKRFMGDLNREDMEVQRCVKALKKHFGVNDEAI